MNKFITGAVFLILIIVGTVVMAWVEDNRDNVRPGDVYSYSYRFKDNDPDSVPYYSSMLGVVIETKGDKIKLMVVWVDAAGEVGRHDEWRQKRDLRLWKKLSE